MNAEWVGSGRFCCAWFVLGLSTIANSRFWTNRCHISKMIRITRVGIINLCNLKCRGKCLKTLPTPWQNGSLINSNFQWFGKNESLSSFAVTFRWQTTHFDQEHFLYSQDEFVSGSCKNLLITYYNRNQKIAISQIDKLIYIKLKQVHISYIKYFL